MPTVLAIVNSTLDPLATIVIKLNRALVTAKTSTPPAPFIPTITAAIDTLHNSWQSLQAIVATFDPDTYSHEL